MLLIYNIFFILDNYKVKYELLFNNKQIVIYKYIYFNNKSVGWL